MRHVVLDQWSRRNSFLHRRDPRAKILALVAFLVAVATTYSSFGFCAAAYFALLAVAFVCARLPVAGAFARAAVVLPFSLAFAAVTALAGDTARAVMLVVKSYLSAAGVLLLVSTTPLPELLRGMEMLGAPPFLMMVAQFLYRYLFVISEEAQNMRVAGVSRGATLRSLAGRAARFRAAAGALAVLFARSYARAGDIHRAMLARGFEGRFRLPSTRRFGWPDAAFLLAALLLVVSVRAVAYDRRGAERQSSIVETRITAETPRRREERCSGLFAPAFTVAGGDFLRASSSSAVLSPRISFTGETPTLLRVLSFLGGRSRGTADALETKPAWFFSASLYLGASAPRRSIWLRRCRAGSRRAGGHPQSRFGAPQ